MRMIEIEMVDEAHAHAIFSDEDGRMLIINLTHEGVIMDAFTGGGNEFVDSMAMMADEWFDKIAGATA